MRAAILGSGACTPPPRCPSSAVIFRSNIPWTRGMTVDLRRCVAWKSAQPSRRPWRRSPPGSPPSASPCPAPSQSAPTGAASPAAAATPTPRRTDAELADYQPLFDNARKLRGLLAELQDLTLAIVEAPPAATRGSQLARTPTGSG